MPNTKISRSASTGKIVTKKKAAKHPRTTVSETVTGYQRQKKNVVGLLQQVARGPYGELKTTFIYRVKTAAAELLKKIN